MEYKDIFSPKTLEKLNKKSAENLKTMLGDKNLMQTMMSSQQILSQIARAEAPYKSKLEQLAIQMVKELYPIVDEEGIVLDAELGDMSDIGRELDEITVNKPNHYFTISMIPPDPEDDEEYTSYPTGEIIFPPYLKGLEFDQIGDSFYQTYFNNITKYQDLYSDLINYLDSKNIRYKELAAGNSRHINIDSKYFKQPSELDEIKINNPTPFETLKRNLIKLIKNDIHNYGFDEDYEGQANEIIKDIKNSNTKKDLEDAINDWVWGDKETTQHYFDLATYKEKYNNPLISESITPESRRRIINAITQGAALRGTFAFYLFKEHLDDLDPSLVDAYNQIMKNSFGIYDDENAIAMMLSLLAQGHKMAGGSSKVIINEAESGITIRARAANFPMLVHELIKGLYELISLQGFKGDKTSNQAVVDKVDLLKNEPSDIRYGKFIYDALNRVFINSEYNDPRIREFFFTEVYQLEDDEFIEFIENAINEELTSLQQKWVNNTLRDIASDLKADDYDATGLGEIKINKISPLRIIKKGDDWALLADEKYIFDNHYGWDKRYTIIYAHIDVEVDDNDNEYLEVYIPEPSFGGGASEEEIEAAYDEYETNLSIAESVLSKHSTESSFDSYRIPLNRISGIDLIPTINEIKINKPSVDPKLVSLADAKKDLKQITNKEILPLNLKLGKYNLSGNEQGVELTWNEGSNLLSSTTKQNALKLFNDILGIEPAKVYVGIVPREGKAAKSFYILGEYNNIPLILARKETSTPGAGQTFLISPTFKSKYHEYSGYYYNNADNEVLKQNIIKDFNLGNLDEIKVSRPERRYFLNPEFKSWLNQNYEDIRYELGEDVADAITMFREATQDNKTISISDIKKFLNQDEGMEEAWGDPDSFLSFLEFMDVVQDRPTTNEIKTSKSFTESFLESFSKEIKTTINSNLKKYTKVLSEKLLNEYSEKTIATTIERWKKENPKVDDNLAKQLIQRFDQIKSGLAQKLEIVVLPDELKKGQNYLNIDKYSFDDMVKLIRSLPENPDKVKKDAIGKFVQQDRIDKPTAQSYVARFIANKDKLKLAAQEGLEDEGFTKEEVLNFIPKKLLSNNAYLDPRVWSWSAFEQMMDALFPSQKTAEEGEENLVSTDADKIYDKNGIEIYKGDDVHKCISYNPINPENKRKKYGWCVTQTGNTMYDTYRFKDSSPTFYFVFDRNKPSTPQHAPFDDEWHAFVIQVSLDGKEYVVTGANNRGDINTRDKGWEGIKDIVPADTWAKIKGLKDYFKPIGLSSVERSRKFASGKNLSLSEFKELSQDEKIQYVQGKASQNKLTPDILEILPQYKINYEGRSTTLANIAIDNRQKFPYVALKNNEALAKRYAVVSSRYYPNDPLPLPFIQYLDEEAKQKYLEKYDNNLTFEYIEKYFGDNIAEKYVEKQLKNLDYLPKSAIKYIKNDKLRKLFEIYSKLFDSWKFGSQTNISDEALENTSNMPEQEINTIPFSQKQWSDLSPAERKAIIELAEKFNKNLQYQTLLWALPFLIKNGDKTNILLPKSTKDYQYDSWVLVDESGKVVKDNISGDSELGGQPLYLGYPSEDDDFNRIYNIKDLKIN